MLLQNLYQAIKDGVRLAPEQALHLATHGDFLKLAQLANTRSKALNGTRVAFLIDRNINYTNICKAVCRFCAFYRKPGNKDAYVLSRSELDQKIKEAIASGATQILLQGGIHPDWKIDEYEKLIGHIQQNHDIMIHAFSPSEIHYFSKLSGLSYEGALTRLKKVGLNSIPGGGAEILVDRVRDRISIDKCSTNEWLGVMEAAHNVGLKTTSTMMLGHVETWAERIEHLARLRDLQDKTGGFVSFIPWTFQPENTALHPKLKKNTDVRLATAHEYLRLIAIARLFLDNFQHIQTSNLTLGVKVGQTALHFGADDMGSIMLEENVVSSAGCDGATKLDSEILVGAILETGHEPYQRDTFYNEVRHDCTRELIKKVAPQTRYAAA